MEDTKKFMAEYGRKMKSARPRSLGTLERALRRHMLLAMEKFDALTALPMGEVYAMGLPRFERKREVAQEAVAQYRSIIEAFNQSGGAS